MARVFYLAMFGNRYSFRRNNSQNNQNYEPRYFPPKPPSECAKAKEFKKTYYSIAHGNNPPNQSYVDPKKRVHAAVKKDGGLRGGAKKWK